MATEKNLTNLPAAPSGARNGTFQVDPTPSGTDATTGQPYFNVSIYMPDMVGDTGSGGQDGLVPAPAAGDAAAGKFLKADGTWAVNGGSVTASQVQQEAFTYAADTGSSNAYAVTLSPAPTVVAGSQVVFKAANTNTGASTLAVNGGSTTAIKKDGAVPLDAGDISSGQIVICIYDGTNWQAQGLAPALILIPSLRGSGIISDTGVSSKTITLPSGSQDGDFAVLFANGYFAPSVPSGWTDLSIASQSTWQAIGASKILSSGDISTGSVSVSFGGSGNCVLAIAVFVGSTGGVREVESGDNAGAPITITNTTTSAVLNSDVAIYFATARNPSATPTITPGSGSATTLQSETTNTHSVLADQLMPGGVIAVANLFSSAGSGATAAQIIVQGASSGIGSVSSVGLTVPSRQTVSGSPVTSSGTLTITDNTQNANLVFAGPSSGSAAAPTFRTLVSADVPGSLSNPMTTEGDIIYGGASGAPTRLAAGTSGQVLQTNGSSAAPTWVTGGGGFSPYPSMTPPLSANFTWLNPNSYTVTNTDKTSREVITAASGTLGAMWVDNTSLPTTPYTIDAGFIIASGLGTTVISLALKDGGGAIRSYGIRANSSGLWYLSDQSWSSVTSPGSENNTTGTFLEPNSILFLRITDDGTHRTIYWSNNGNDYQIWIQQATNTGITPVTVGLLFYQSAGLPIAASIYHWLISNSILPQFAT